MSGLTIITRKEQGMSKDDDEKFTVEHRWVRTREGALVREDEATDGGNLTYRGGEVISRAQAEADGFFKTAEKQAEPVANKKQPKGGDK